MSRVGKSPIPLPKGASVKVVGSLVTAKGPLGELSYELRPGMGVVVEDGHVRVVNNTDPSNPEKGKALHGVSRAMVANCIEGVSKGFSKGLEIVGTGWRAAMSGTNLEISLGYAQPVKVTVPDGLKAEVADKPPRIKITGIRKDQVGQFAAEIRALRPPEPYLGKGIKYENEQIRRKAGKSAG
jgi:large subunit ribosomal protein L6